MYNIMWARSEGAIVMAALLIAAGLIFPTPLVIAQDTGSDTTAVMAVEDSTSHISIDPGTSMQINRLTSTASVSTVGDTTVYKTPAANLSNTLYGRLLGLMTLQGSGEPGRDAADLLIRGVGTFNNQDIAIFVDGFRTDLSYAQYLSPSEIESISVLKDAAALTPLGMQVSNGALWVTTKRGYSGEPELQVKTRMGVQNPVNINKPLNSYEYARLYNEAISNDNGMVWTPAYSSEELEAYRNGTGTNVDWYDEVLRSNAPYTEMDVTFRGGGSSVRYFGMLGYMGNSGIYEVPTDDLRSNANHERINLRTNLDFDLFDVFEGRVVVGGRLEDRKYPNFDSSTLWSNLASYPSNIYPVRNDNGTWTGTSVYPDNPVASVRELGWRSYHDRSVDAKVFLKEKLDFITEGLYVSQGFAFNNWMRGTYNKTKNYARYLGEERQTTDQNTQLSIFDDNLTSHWDWKHFTASAGYQNIFEKHEIAGEVDYLVYMRELDSSLNGAAGIHTSYGYQNVGGRLRYVFDDRYAAEFGFSYSGSDNFAKGNRWGFYPAISAAWIISNESFFGSGSIVDYLKVRASAGRTGNDHTEQGRYLYEGYYINSGGFYTGTGSPEWRSGLVQPYAGNPNLFAELSTKYNLGLETTVFSNLDLTLDAFLDKRSDIIAQDFSLSGTFGADPPYRNIGQVTNRGIEASILFNKSTGDTGYFVGGLISYATNKVDYMAEVITVPNASQTGRRIGTPFGLEADGFYGIGDFKENGDLRDDLPEPTFGPVQPGDIKYVDVNRDGRIDEQDEIRIGNPYVPTVEYSVTAGGTYGGFDLELLLQGAGGRSVNLLDARDQTLAFVNDRNAYELAEDRWAYYPDEGIDTRDTASYPRLTTEGNTNNYRNSTFWMKDGWFLRLRNIELGYTLPNRLTNAVGFSKGRIFATATNLFTWSPVLSEYQIDPETMSGHPAMQTFTGGLAINF